MRTWKEIIEIEMMDCDHRDIDRLINDSLVMWAMELAARETVEEIEYDIDNYIEVDGSTWNYIKEEWVKLKSKLKQGSI